MNRLIQDGNLEISAYPRFEATSTNDYALTTKYIGDMKGVTLEIYALTNDMLLKIEVSNGDFTRAVTKLVNKTLTATYMYHFTLSEPWKYLHISIKSAAADVHGACEFYLKGGKT